MFGVGHVPIVAFKVYQMSVHIGVFKLLVAENVLDEFDVFGSMIFHGCFLMSERMRGGTSTISKRHLFSQDSILKESRPLCPHTKTGSGLERTR